MPIPLSPDLGIEHAADLKATLSPQLGSRRTVVLDASAVKRVHTASLQLLCAFISERSQAGHATRIDKPTDTLVDAARVLGLQTALGLENPGDNR